MKPRLRCALIMILGLAAALASTERQADIKLGKSLEIGRGEFHFGSIASVCEDNDRNFYVLDDKQFTVFEFSPDGRLLRKFGAKGQGPGDLQSPRLIIFTPHSELAVLEDLNYVTYFDVRGTFLKRLDLNGRLGLRYLGPDRFLGWVWQPEGRQQVLVDAKNNIKAAFWTQPRTSFSTSLADETGRAVMFNYVSDDYVPELLFGFGGGVGLVGISTQYDLTLMDGEGKAIGSIRRDLKPGKISGAERTYLEQGIREFARAHTWPAAATREIIKKVPDHKTMIRAVRLSLNYVFVFLVPPDISREGTAMPVDIFSLKGTFLGSTSLNQIPLFISGKAMYFVETDDEGNEYLKRYDYSLSQK